VRLTLLAAGLLLAIDASAQTTAVSGGQTFRAGTELVLVDVSVLDGDGTPVPNLAASDFRLSVGGKPRPIRSVQFIQTEPAAVVGATPPVAETSSNQLPASGRHVLIVVDESNLRIGAAIRVVREAERLLAQLSPGDLVGVSRIPYGGGIEFTADRARVVEALKSITGRPPRPRSRVTVFLSEAHDFEDTGRRQWPAALKRECGEPNTPGYSQCVPVMQMEATSILREEEQKRATTVSTLHNLMTSSGATGVPVIMVLISESLFLARDPGALAGLAAAGAAARVSLHVVRPAISPYDISTQGFSSDPSWDEELRRSGLQTLAAQFRGAFHEVSATGSRVFEQIGRELSGYYLLGIDSADEDRTGRARRLNVEVTRPGVTVRARPTFALPTDAPGVSTMDATTRLKALLRSPAPAPEIPMTITAAALAGPANNKMRLLIAAELGAGTEQRDTYLVGVIVLDSRGEVVAQMAGPAALSPARSGRQSPALFTTSFEVAPGDYSIRLAGIDSQGRAGSVHHQVTAQAREWPGKFRTSDLIVAPRPEPGQFPVFTPSAVIDGNEVAAVIEVSHPEPATLAEAAVRFEIAAPDGRVFLAIDAMAPEAPQAPKAQAGGGENRRSFAQAFRIPGLPAGNYLLRAVVTHAGQAVATVVKPFRRERPPAR
jgi:VWFA-related protein